MAKDKMTNYWICEGSEKCTTCLSDHKKPHVHNYGCNRDCYVDYHTDDVCHCKKMTRKEYAVWRLTK